MGSTEQHGPTGLMGTDCICPEVIARRAGDKAGFLVGPTFAVGSAQHHMAFPGSMTLRPSTFVAALYDWIVSLAHHGFKRVLVLNGHGGNVASVQAAFAEVYADYSLARRGANAAPLRMTLVNWWELKGVLRLCKELFPKGHGSHATPSEVAVTYFAYPEAIKSAKLEPKIAPDGPILDAADYRRRFPDGRIGSDPSLATPELGEKLVDCAVEGLIETYEKFLAA
jgi:creatinine amidohydrolase/Fe(II)-dependent formamide hydrolase-like protein